MKRIALLVALGFLVLSASTYVGVLMAREGERGNRAEYVPRSMLKDFQKGSLPEILSVEQRAQFEQHREVLMGSFRRNARRREGDLWYFAYCFENGGRADFVVPEDGNVERFQVVIRPPGERAAPCGDENG